MCACMRSMHRPYSMGYGRVVRICVVWCGERYVFRECSVVCAVSRLAVRGSVVCVLVVYVQKVCYLEMCEEYCRCLGVVNRVCERTSWRFLSENPATEQGQQGRDDVSGENLR